MLFSCSGHGVSLGVFHSFALLYPPWAKVKTQQRSFYEAQNSAGHFMHRKGVLARAEVSFKQELYSLDIEIKSC
jgi:hypothetical protein